MQENNVIDTFRNYEILIIHPEDEDRNVLITHLKRIGCKVTKSWPSPRTIDKHINIVLFLANREDKQKRLHWLSSAENITRVAIVDYETPEVLLELHHLNTHGLITKPIRIFGLLASLITAVSISTREYNHYQRVEKLDANLKARIKIEKAVQIIATKKSINENMAYSYLRDLSMKKRISIYKLAEIVIKEMGNI